MSMTLYELSQTAKQLYELLEAGEIDEAVLTDTLESIGASEKLQDYTYVMKSMESEIAMFDVEIARLRENKRVLENRVEYLKNKVIEFMQATNQKTANAGTFKLTMRENKSCEIEDESKIPLKYMKEIPAKLEPDKREMLKALKSGEHIAGASLKSSFSVTMK